MSSWRIAHPSTRVSQYAFNGNALDGTGRYPGTLVNAPTWARFMKGPQCIELDGDDAHVNIGDVAELNEASAFTICFWMAQDVLDVIDHIFRKYIAASDRIHIYTHIEGNMYFVVANGASTYGSFDYSTIVSALNWHHVAMVFDGTQAADASRLVVYVDGNPITLAFTGPIPIATADLAGYDGYVGFSNVAFDGKLYDFRIASCAYSRDEVIAIIHEAVPVLA